MHLNRLRALVAVIEEGGFSQAARRLGISQPAISQQIKALEASLGATLIERHAEPVRATAAGRIAYRQFHAILSLWQETEAQIRQLKERTTGRLTLGASTVPATYLLPGLIFRFREENPQVDLSVEVSDSEMVRDWVLSQRVDVGAVGLHREDRRLAHRLLGQDQLLLIAPCSHRWATGSPIDPTALLSEALITRERGSGTRQAMEEALKAWGLDPAELDVRIELGSTEAVVSAVEAGLGVSFVSQWAVRPALALGRVCTVPVQAPPIRRNFYLIYRRSRAKDTLVQRFIHLVEDQQSRQSSLNVAPWDSAGVGHG